MLEIIQSWATHFVVYSFITTLIQFFVMKLTLAQWYDGIVVTERTRNGVRRYFPRNQRTLRRMYAIDSTMCGFTDSNLPRKAIVLNTEDEIIR